MKKSFLFLSCLATLTTVFAASVEVPVTVRQNWPWDSKVILDVTMPEGTNDVAFTAEFLHDGERVSTELDIRTAIDGSSYCLTGGVHRLVWDPVAAGYSKPITEFKLKAEAVPANDRAWLVLEVASGKTEFVALGDEPRDANGWPWQDAKYKNTHMVFRRIPAGVFTMGYTADEKKFFTDNSPSGTYYIADQLEVEMTSDYYIAIYPTTSGQGHRIVDAASTLNSTGAWMGDGTTLGAAFPCFQRGSNTVEGISWPETKFRVTPNSHVAMLRERCGNRFVFDQPTAAQWQKAMRPDPQWLWYDTPTYGGGKITDSLETVTNILTVISQIPKMMEKGGNQWGAPSSVGLYQPNSYGLYDSVGSRLEFVLDQFNYNVSDFKKVRIDPVGPTRNTAVNPQKRVMFGSWQPDKSLAKWTMASFSACTSDQPADSSQGRAYRYAIHLNPPKSFNGAWE